MTRYADDELAGHHILVTSGAPTYTELFITKFFQSDGDALYRPEEAAALDTLTYEILPFSGTDFFARHPGRHTRLVRRGAAC